MRFSLVATAFIPVLSVAADNILVTVGANNLLAFSPPNVTANVGDTISFQFQSKNHSVTQSTFADPCSIQTTPAPGIDSGFQFVAPGSTSLPQYSFTVNNASAPLWFFCAQTNPANHCHMGMVFAVNANPNSAKSFAVYQANAMSNNAGAGAGSPGVSSLGDAATSIAASIGDAATSAAAGFGSEATSVVASIGSEATAAAGGELSSLLGGGSPTSSAGNSNPSLTSSGAGGNTTGQTGAGFRLERSASLPVLAAIGFAGAMLL